MPETRKRILLVDDEEELLRMLRIFLKSENFDVFIAHDGREAMELLPETKPDLVITDLEMPDVHGIMLVSALKKHAQGQRIPVMVMTSHTEVDNVLDCVEAGADDFVSKPIKLNDLKTRIALLLKKYT